MTGNFPEFDIIQRAIHRTYHMLENDESASMAVDGLRAAQEQYLLALSHKTLIDTNYLKAMME